MPLLLLVFLLLIKEQYVKGNISKRIVINKQQPVVHALKPFRHVVFDGRVIYKIGNLEKPMGSTERLEMNVGGPGSFRLEVDRNREQILRYAYVGDTLFIRYRLEDFNGRDHWWRGGVTLYAPELASVTGTAGSVVLQSFRQHAPLVLHTGWAGEFSAFNLRVPLLQLNMESASKLELQGAEIDSLAYDMQEASELIIKQPYTIRALNPGKVDSLSNITLSGRASLMRPLVPFEMKLGKKITTKQ
ncbi:hypothetical protein DLD77_04200 [Chitinophaga alhagiae]|uniref:Auto-transporter adhesin head GIN domain-containing protein n=2 Tax=Chitinophaga alhagiae TaxID=2203219 RepID=A0ABN5LTD5_9BACT|nr:hypothetical protein DLD77_04200 [Chitinophaga alhagiae]